MQEASRSLETLCSVAHRLSAIVALCNAVSWFESGWSTAASVAIATHESRTGQVQPNQRSSQGVVEVPDLQQRTYDALKAAS